MPCAGCQRRAQWMRDRLNAIRAEIAHRMKVDALRPERLTPTHPPTEPRPPSDVGGKS